MEFVCVCVCVCVYGYHKLFDVTNATYSTAIYLYVCVAVCCCSVLLQCVVAVCCCSVLYDVAIYPVCEFGCAYAFVCVCAYIHTYIILILMCVTFMCVSAGVQGLNFATLCRLGGCDKWGCQQSYDVANAALAECQVSLVTSHIKQRHTYECIMPYTYV